MFNKRCYVCGAIFLGLIVINEHGGFLCKECYYEPAEHVLEQTYEFYNFSQYNTASGLTSGTVFISIIKENKI